jgi:alpha-mannosidase
VRAQGSHSITNGVFSISAKPGATGIKITCKGKALFKNDGLGAATYEDPWGSWGGLLEEPESLDLQAVRTRWVVSHSKVLESGPERACLWVLLEGGNSRMHLHFYLSRKATSIEVRARLLWNERSARLKLLMPGSADEAEFDVPGGSVFRAPSGEVPGGAWVRTYRRKCPALAFASDAIYGFNLTRKGTLQVSIVRSGRFADDHVLGEKEQPEIPSADAGEYKFRFLLAQGDADIQKLSEELSAPLSTFPVWSHPGTLPPTGSLLHLEPRTLRFLAWKRAENGKDFVLRAMETGSGMSTGFLVLGGQRIGLGRIEPGKIATWCLAIRSGRWVAERSNIVESTSPRRKA